MDVHVILGLFLLGKILLNKVVLLLELTFVICVKSDILLLLALWCAFLSVIVSILNWASSDCILSVLVRIPVLVLISVSVITYVLIGIPGLLLILSLVLLRSLITSCVGLVLPIMISIILIRPFLSSDVPLLGLIICVLLISPFLWSVILVILPFNIVGLWVVPVVLNDWFYGFRRPVVVSLLLIPLVVLRLFVCLLIIPWHLWISLLILNDFWVR